MSVYNELSLDSAMDDGNSKYMLDGNLPFCFLIKYAVSLQWKYEFNVTLRRNKFQSPEFFWVFNVF